MNEIRYRKVTFRNIRVTLVDAIALRAKRHRISQEKMAVMALGVMFAEEEREIEQLMAKKGEGE